MERGTGDRQAPEDQTTQAVPAQRPPQRKPQSQRPQGPARQRQRAPRKRFGVEQARNPEFQMVFRGYEREAVDRYVASVIELITELEATQTREGTVQRALEEVGEQTSRILQQAHESAEEISSHSRAQAEGRLARAEREAEQMVAEAEADASRIRTDTRGVWQQRGRLVEELRRFSDEVLTVADDALERLEPPQEAKPGGPPEAEAAEPQVSEPQAEQDPAGGPQGQAEPETPGSGNGAEEPSEDTPKQRKTVGPIGDPLDIPPQNQPETDTDEQPAVRRVGPERRQG
jgi:cell division septum initiation protein DivIVA